jgi:hypothetical protein
MVLAPLQTVAWGGHSRCTAYVYLLSQMNSCPRLERLHFICLRYRGLFVRGFVFGLSLSKKQGTDRGMKIGKDILAARYYVDHNPFQSIPRLTIDAIFTF